ncbi:uncharacterized protein B0T15DRAFT_277564 [Chaetomium strumarium]|uniref:Uncharacterized protein n=1 Tax=Chaetomium strumarium TaxID=1170767 RepID=A0AAJ0GPI0_9PEZI|nr:hypothetical protein B0T15DRAFT_277564 [Chaetomium strumarium]
MRSSLSSGTYPGSYNYIRGLESRSPRRTMVNATLRTGPGRAERKRFDLAVTTWHVVLLSYHRCPVLSQVFYLLPAASGVVSFRRRPCSELARAYSPSIAPIPLLGRQGNRKIVAAEQSRSFLSLAGHPRARAAAIPPFLRTSLFSSLFFDWDLWFTSSSITCEATQSSKH